MFQIKIIWPKQNEPLCTRQARPCTHGTCVHFEQKNHGKITVYNINKIKHT